MESLLKVDPGRPSGLAKPFVLSVGNERLYAGMFYDPASSVGIYGGHLGVMISNIDVTGPFVRLRLSGVDERDGSDRAHKLKAAFASAGILLGR
jgi:hypothetical protein